MHSPSVLAENFHYAFKWQAQPEISTHPSKWGGRSERHMKEKTMMLNWSFDNQKYFKNNSPCSTQEDAKRKCWNCFVSSYILQNANCLNAPPITLWQPTRVKRGGFTSSGKYKKIIFFPLSIIKNYISVLLPELDTIYRDKITMSFLKLTTVYTVRDL